MSTKATTQESEAKTAHSDTEKIENAEPLRTQELELWDRVLQRWDKHIGRQVKIGVSAVGFFILVVGFLGVRSFNETLVASVETGVTNAASKIQKDIDDDTKRVSDLLNAKLVNMTFEVGMLEREAKRARDLLTLMEEQGKQFEELKTKYNAQLESMEAVSRRYTEIKKDVDQKMAELSTKSAEIESQLKSNLESLERITKDVGRVDKIATTAVLATAAAKEEDSERVTAARPSPPELGSGLLDALGVRQVPTPLAEAGESRRATYLLTTSLFVEETIPPGTAKELLDSIEKVTYTLSERWFSNNVIERTNRQDSFQFTVTVWGVTPIKTRAEFAGKSPPICWSGNMNLKEEIKFARVPCDAS